jgi:hypothetical protein
VSGFDRIKAPDEWARREAGEQADPEGRAALFTGPDAAVRAARPGPPAGVKVHCSRCDQTTPIDGRTALRMAAPLFLLAVWKSHPIFAVCPGCGARSWLRLRV